MTWYKSLWLWRWLPRRLSKRQSLSTTTLLFRTTFTQTIILNLLFKFPCSVSLCFTNFCDAINCASVEKRVFPYLIDSLFNTTSRVTGVVIYLLMPLHCSFQEWHDEIDTCNTSDKVTQHSCIFPFFFFPIFFSLVRFHSVSRTFLSFAWFLRTLKSLCVNRLRSLLRMRCILLGYRFEPRPNSHTLGSVGSVMTICLSIKGCSHSKKTVWREKTRLTSPGVWLRSLQMHDAWLGMEV